MELESKMKGWNGIERKGREGMEWRCTSTHNLSQKAVSPNQEKLVLVDGWKVCGRRRRTKESLRRKKRKRRGGALIKVRYGPRTGVK